jgi:hypothetical protein
MIPESALASLWDRRIKPIKDKLAIQSGIRLYGIKIKSEVRTIGQGRWQSLLTEAGLPNNAAKSVRFVLSAFGWENISQISIASDLFHCIELVDGDQEISRAMPQGGAVVSQVKYDALLDFVSDAILDMSYANGYWPQKLLVDPSTNSLEIVWLSAQKAKFASERGYITGDNLKYACFSSIARGDSKFGSEDHLNRFVEIWDDFILEMLGTAQISESSSLKLLAKYPSWNNRVSEQSLADVLSKQTVPVAVLLVERRSLNARTNPKFRNVVNGIKSKLAFSNRRGPFVGLFNGAILPSEIAQCIDSKVFYALRVQQA